MVPVPEDMDASDGSTPRPVMRKRSKARAPKGKTKRLEMALDSGSNAASSKDIETNVQNVEDEEVGELSMTYG